MAVVAITAVALIALASSVKIVPQSEEAVVERMGRYLRTLKPGIRMIVPVIDRVQHRISVLERQLEPFKVSVITADNVEVVLESTVFMRVVAAEKAVYRIESFADAVRTTATSLMRNAAGKLELDGMQSSRDTINQTVQRKLAEAAELWGIEITRTEVMDVVVDDRTKEAQRQQLNAERERRARVAEAEGERRAVELAADAALYEAQKRAQAVKVEADARAYEIATVAEAQRLEIEKVGDALAEKGEGAAMFEVRKRQVAAIEALARSENTKIMVVPAEVVGVLGAIETLGGMIRGAAGTRET